MLRAALTELESVWLLLYCNMYNGVHRHVIPSAGGGQHAIRPPHTADYTSVKAKERFTCQRLMPLLQIFMNIVLVIKANGVVAVNYGLV